MSNFNEALLHNLHRSGPCRKVGIIVWIRGTKRTTVARKEILRLMIGFRRFKERYFNKDESLYQKLSGQGQTPKTLIIGCSDSRVDPAIISSAEPGELFIVRNVANLVPPCISMDGVHGVSSAIEFAVENLKVENIIVLGHRQCGGIRALMESKGPFKKSFIGQWMQVSLAAKESVLKKYGSADFETQCLHCEMESIVISMENLKTFPFVRAAMRDRDMQIIGAYFDLEKGELLEYDQEQNGFRNILPD